jgi:hypothetical protein
MFDPDTSDDDGFDQWLLRFVEPSTASAGNESYRIRQFYSELGCYHPANRQCRHLASHYIPPQFMGKPVINPKDGFEPNATEAIEVLRSLSFVAVQDFFHESKCLLLYRMANMTTDSIRQYMETCQCPITTSPNDKKVTHHQGGRRSTLLDLKPSTLNMVDTLTRMDDIMFRSALQDFLREIVWLEEQLGRRVMCDETLRKREPEIQYLGLNVTDMYYDLKGCFG